VWDRIASAVDETPGTDVPRLRPVGYRTDGRRWAVPAVAAVAAAVIALLGVVVVQQGNEIDRIRSSQEALDPRAREVVLATPADGTVLARAVVRPDGSGYLIAGDLPDLPSDRTYQLWGVMDDRTVSLGVLGHRPGVVAFSADPDTTALAVTAEERGGVVQSRNQPVVSGRVAAAA
jgi:anti-sigma-K factor RskA